MPVRHVPGHMPGHMLEYVPKHVPDRHVPEHVIARQVLGLYIFLNAETVFYFFRTACAIR